MRGVAHAATDCSSTTLTSLTTAPSSSQRRFAVLRATVSRVAPAAPITPPPLTLGPYCAFQQVVVVAVPNSHSDRKPQLHGSVYNPTFGANPLALPDTQQAGLALWSVPRPRSDVRSSARHKLGFASLYEVSGPCH